MSTDVRISGNRIDGGPAPDLDQPRRQLIAEVIALACQIRDAERANGGEVSGDATLLAYAVIKNERERALLGGESLAETPGPHGDKCCCAECTFAKGRAATARHERESMAPSPLSKAQRQEEEQAVLRIFDLHWNNEISLSQAMQECFRAGKARRPEVLE